MENYAEKRGKTIHISEDIVSPRYAVDGHQGPLLPTWINFNPSMDT